jgi:hypothetical protein
MSSKHSTILVLELRTRHSELILSITFAVSLCHLCRLSELNEANIQILQTVAQHLNGDGLTTLAEVMVARIISCGGETAMAMDGE